MKNVILQGDCLESLRGLPDESVDCVITSPPYFGLRDYGIAGQIGLEHSPDEYVEKIVAVFREVRRVMKKEATLWLNLGDTYSADRWSETPSTMNKNRDGHRSIAPKKNSGLPPKNLIGIPWRVAFALQADGWLLRQDIIWHKPNPMPESVQDRCTKAHEYVFLMSKSPRYYYDAESIKEPAVWGNWQGRLERESVKSFPDNLKNGIRTSKKRGEFNGKTNALVGREAFRSIKDMRNKRSVWSVSSRPFKEAHFATFPEKLIEPMVLAGCPKDGVVLDPFMGAGTTAVVARKLGRHYLGIELNREYIKIAEKRLQGVPLSLFQPA